MDMPCKCSKETEISAINTRSEDMYKVLNGNGKPGVRDTVVTLSERVESLSDKMDTVGVKIDRMIESKRFHITTIISIAAVVIAIIAIILQ